MVRVSGRRCNRPACTEAAGLDGRGSLHHVLTMEGGKWCVGAHAYSTQYGASEPNAVSPTIDLCCIHGIAQTFAPALPQAAPVHTMRCCLPHLTRTLSSHPSCPAGSTVHTAQDAAPRGRPSHHGAHVLLRMSAILQHATFATVLYTLVQSLHLLSRLAAFRVLHLCMQLSQGINLPSAPALSSCLLLLHPAGILGGLCEGRRALGLVRPAPQPRLRLQVRTLSRCSLHLCLKLLCGLPPRWHGNTVHLAAVDSQAH